MTVPNRILAILAQHGPMTRRQISDTIGVIPEHLSPPLLRLLKTKEIVQHHRCRQSRIYSLPDQHFAKSVADEIQKAKRYKAGDMLLIDARLADKAVEALRSL